MIGTLAGQIYFRKTGIISRERWWDQVQYVFMNPKLFPIGKFRFVEAV